MNRKSSRKNRKNRKHRKNRTNNISRRRKQRGGSASFPDVFGTTLDANLRASAGVDKIDAAFAQLPQFVGYGTQVGGRRNTRTHRKGSRKNRKNNRKNSRKNRQQRGGAWGDQFAAADAPSNLMPKDMYAYAHTNPQFYNENVVNPNFSGPSNSYAN